jgi:hypothetical protein
MSAFDELVSEAVEEELSGSEVMELFDKKLGFLLYERLYNFNSVLEGKDATIILYQFTRFEGHYIILLKHNDNTYELFDPLGYEPDYELKFLPYNKDPQLSTLIKRYESNGGKVIINRTKFERDADRVNTCGRHCIVRYSFKEMSLSEYTEFIRSSKIKTDKLITIMTLIIKH